MAAQVLIHELVDILVESLDHLGMVELVLLVFAIGVLALAAAVQHFILDFILYLLIDFEDVLAFEFIHHVFIVVAGQFLRCFPLGASLLFMVLFGLRRWRLGLGLLSPGADV